MKTKSPLLARVVGTYDVVRDEVRNPWRKLLVDVLSHVANDFGHVAEDFCYVAEDFSQQFQPTKTKVVRQTLLVWFSGQQCLPTMFVRTLWEVERG